MGQRLAIFIYEEKNEEEVPLAVAYYHWSAYTDKATALLQKVLDCLESNSDELEKNKLLYVIKALEATGAGLISETDSQEVHVSRICVVRVDVRRKPCTTTKMQCVHSRIESRYSTRHIAVSPYI